MRRPATCFGLEAELLRQLGRLRAAAVDDRDARTSVDEDAQVRRQQLRLARPDDLTADLDDGRASHGQLPVSSRLAFSSSPRMRFMFWIAWPAPPLIKLSIAAKQVTVRLPAWTGPTLNPTSM